MPDLQSARIVSVKQSFVSGGEFGKELSTFLSAFRQVGKFGCPVFKGLDTQGSIPVSGTI